MGWLKHGEYTAVVDAEPGVEGALEAASEAVDVEYCPWCPRFDRQGCIARRVVHVFCRLDSFSSSGVSEKKSAVEIVGTKHRRTKSAIVEMGRTQVYLWSETRTECDKDESREGGGRHRRLHLPHLSHSQPERSVFQPSFFFALWACHMCLMAFIVMQGSCREPARREEASVYWHHA